MYFRDGNLLPWGEKKTHPSLALWGIKSDPKNTPEGWVCVFWLFPHDHPCSLANYYSHSHVLGLFSFLCQYCHIWLFFLFKLDHFGKRMFFIIFCACWMYGDIYDTVYLPDLRITTGFDKSGSGSGMGIFLPLVWGAPFGVKKQHLWSSGVSKLTLKTPQWMNFRLLTCFHSHP